jgi:hypothetical protein
LDVCTDKIFYISNKVLATIRELAALTALSLQIFQEVMTQ